MTDLGTQSLLAVIYCYCKLQHKKEIETTQKRPIIRIRYLEGIMLIIFDACVGNPLIYSVILVAFISNHSVQIQSLPDGVVWEWKVVVLRVSYERHKI